MAVAAAVLAGAIPLAHGQDTNTVVQKLKSHFTLTQISGNHNDIVTAGSVLVLHKDRLVMYSLANPLPPQSTYKKGRITHNVLGGKSFLRDLGNTMQHPDDSNIQQRVFVSGEKFWVIGISAVNDGVIFRLYSDPYDDVRYWGELKFPFPKGSVPPADEVAGTVAEVLTVDDDSANNAQQPAAPAAPAAPTAPAAPAEAAPAAIPPPAPPPPDPKTISLGQTKDDVVATFGQPQKVVKLGTKQIYYYSDMKVTLVNGKVTDVADIAPAR
jgi:hypothetical protein